MTRRKLYEKTYKTNLPYDCLYHPSPCRKLLYLLFFPLPHALFHSEVTSYEDGYNLYQIDIKYDYDLDQIIDYGITDNQSMIDAIIKEALPLLPVKIKAPDFGCTAFTMTDNQNQVHMGRNYDFKLDTSAMLVYCTPQNGYKSVAFAALDNISANTPDESMKKKTCHLDLSFHLP